MICRARPPPPQRRPDPVFLTVTSDLAWPRRGAARAGPLGPALDRATKGDRETRIFLRADADVPYGELMGVMDLLRAAGYLKVALVALETVAAGSARP